MSILLNKTSILFEVSISTFIPYKFTYYDTNGSILSYNGSFLAYQTDLTGGFVIARIQTFVTTGCKGRGVGLIAHSKTFVTITGIRIVARLARGIFALLRGTITGIRIVARLARGIFALLRGCHRA